MAGSGGVEAGAIVACPRCGSEVREHSMIPVLAESGTEQLVCVACARTFVVTGTPA